MNTLATRVSLLLGWILVMSLSHAEEDAFSREAAGILAMAEKAENDPAKGPSLDRTRGRIVFEATEGRYESGEHFGKWSWPDFTGTRRGAYQVRLIYGSVIPRQGAQFFIGAKRAKGYLGPTGGVEKERKVELGRISIPDRSTYPVGMLSGDASHGPGFRLHRVELEPAPEGEWPSQAIDGTVTLDARDAATFSRSMCYDPVEGRYCLGNWTEVDDWAEWMTSVHEGRRFRVELSYGCGGGDHGSEVVLWVNDAPFPFQVEDTGGHWKPRVLGEVELGEGWHRVVIKPVNKRGNGILQVRKVMLTPLTGP